MDEKPKRVLIACPTLGLEPDPDQWLTTLLVIINDIRRNKMVHACLFPYKMTWWPANNFIWDVAFRQEFDYILRLDDDVWGASMDAFSHLLAQDKDVIGAAYPLRDFPYSLAAYNRIDDNQSIVDCAKNNRVNPASLAEVSGRGVVRCDLVGFGMTLIKVDPFRKIPRPIYKGEQVCPDDSYFAQICLDNKIEQYVDFDVALNHRHVMHHNRGYLFNADARALIMSGQITRGNNQFWDTLLDNFGDDGIKDFGHLKGSQPEKRIITPR